MTRVTVVGGGVVGLASAYYLSEAGADVTVLEKHSIASEASYGNGGLIVPSHCVPFASPAALRQFIRWSLRGDSPVRVNPISSFGMLSWMARFWGACRLPGEERRKRARSLLGLGRLSLRLFERLAKSGLPQFEFERRGLLEVYHSHKELQAAQSHARGLREEGFELEVLDAEAAHEFEPALTKDVIGGIFDPEASQANPKLFAAALAMAIERLGGKVLEFMAARGFGVEGNRVAVVKTGRGDYKCDAVVLAAGPWSPMLARRLGVKLPIQPGKGYMVMLPPLRRRLKAAVAVAESGIYLTQQLDGRVRCVGALELLGFDRTIKQSRVRWMLSNVGSVVPGASEAGVEEAWCGFRPCTPDGLPIIGLAPGYSNLVVAAGHCRLGFTLAPATGRAVSELVLEKRPSMPVEAFDPARFA